MRTPRLHSLFSTSNDKGLIEALLEPENSQSCLYPVASGLTLLAAHHVKHPPQHLLLGERFGQLLTRMRQEFDIILIDTPPALGSVDAQCVVANTDQVLLVARQHHSSIADLKALHLQMDDTCTPVLGVVLTQF